MPAFCAIDFGTSNSAIALPAGEGVRLVELEPGQPTMPTAVFYAVEGLAAHEEPQRHYGRAAVAAYVEGIEGRLMRSMKSILGSTLVDAVHRGRRRPFGALPRRRRRLPAAPEGAWPKSEAGHELDARWCSAGRCSSSTTTPSATPRPRRRCCRRRARSGFGDVHFQYEPIAAAFDYETTRRRASRLVLVADIGGGTSDFSLVRVGPAAAPARSTARTTSWPTTACTSPAPTSTATSSWPASCRSCGYGAFGPPRADRAARGAEPRLLRPGHLAPDQHRLRAGRVCSSWRACAASTATLRTHARLMTRGGRAAGPRAGGAGRGGEDRRRRRAAALHRPGPGVAARPACACSCRPRRWRAIAGRPASASSRRRARRWRQAGLERARVDALYFTGGSTGLQPLAQAHRRVLSRGHGGAGRSFCQRGPGLGVHAQRLFGALG